MYQKQARIDKWHILNQNYSNQQNKLKGQTGKRKKIYLYYALKNGFLKNMKIKIMSYNLTYGIFLH